MLTRTLHTATASAAALFAAGLAAPAAAQSPCGDSYTIGPGDTLYAVTQACRVPMVELLAANPRIDNPRNLQVGWTLDMPGARDERANLQPRGGAEPRHDRGERQARGDYRVRAGDTLAGIAAEIGVSLADLLAANAGIDPYDLAIGETISLPGESEPDRDRDRWREARSLSVSPDRGLPGQLVTLSGSNFEPNAQVRIGVGEPESEYRVIETARASADGDIRIQTEVPEWADRGEDLVWTMVGADGAQAYARGFDVEASAMGGPETDIYRVSGVISNEGVECPTLRSDSGELYALAGDIGRFGPGDRVKVRGTTPEMSYCMQGTTLAVEEIRAIR